LFRNYVCALCAIVLLYGILPAHATENRYVEIGSSLVFIKDDFSAQAVICRNGDAATIGGINFYMDDASKNYFGFHLRWIGASNCELYGVKYVEGKRAYLIAEENEDHSIIYHNTHQNDWNPDLDEDMELTVSVVGKDAIAQLKGLTSGKSVTLHYDLTKSAVSEDGTAMEEYPKELFIGRISKFIRNGRFLSLAVDVESYKYRHYTMAVYDNGGKEVESVKKPEGELEAGYVRTALGDFLPGQNSPGVYSFSSLSIPYQIYLPKDYDETKSYPLLLFLHGAGLMGTDNKKVIASGEYTVCKKIIERQLDVIIIAPQSPVVWIEFDEDRAGKVPSPRGGVVFDQGITSLYLDGAVALMEAAKVSLAVDESRVFAHGYSWGSHATWYLLAAHPDMFAAAILCCGSGSIEKADEIAKTPIYVVHGDNDSVISFEADQKLSKAIKEAGGDVTFHAIVGGQHGLDYSLNRYSNKIIKWLLEKSK